MIEAMNRMLSNGLVPEAQLPDKFFRALIALLLLSSAYIAEVICGPPTGDCQAGSSSSTVTNRRVRSLASSSANGKADDARHDGADPAGGDDDA